MDRLAAAVEHVVRRGGDPVQRLRARRCLWSGLSAWFGYRKFQGRIFRFVVVGPLLALGGAFVGAASPVDVVDRASTRSAWLYDSAKLRHVVTAGLVFGVPLRARRRADRDLRNREYAALTAHLEAEARQSELSRQLAESQLKLLQLQIEPHFLFNTLGSAQQLAEKGAPDAARLIARPDRVPARVDAVDARRRRRRSQQEAALVARLPRDHADAPRQAARVRGRRSGRRSRCARCRPAC